MDHSLSEPLYDNGNINGECLEPRVTSPTGELATNADDEHVAQMNYCPDKPEVESTEDVPNGFGYTCIATFSLNYNHTDVRETKSSEPIDKVVRSVDKTVETIKRSTISQTGLTKKRQKRTEICAKGLLDFDDIIKSDLPILNTSPNIISYGKTDPVDNLKFYNYPQLGSGTYGVVYDITHPKDNKRMAVKSCSSGKDRDEYIVAENEFNAIKKIDSRNCPYIVKYYFAQMICQYNIFQSHIYMEYMDTSLEKFYQNEHFRKEISMDQRELLTRRIIHDIASALLCLEEEDLIHRDIKPDNILVNRKGTFKLTDMGLCTSRSEIRKNANNCLVGTPSYTPPRSARDPIHDDMWRLGFTILEILNGEHPYPGHADISRSLNLLSKWAPKFPMVVSGGMKKLIRHLLKKKDSHRPKSFNVILNKSIIHQVTAAPSDDELAVIHRILDILAKIRNEK